MNKQLKELETKLAVKYKDLTELMSDNIIYLKDFIMYDGTILNQDEFDSELDSGMDGESIANGFSSDGKQIYVETVSAGGYNAPLEKYSPFHPEFKEVFLNYISDENNFDLEDEDVDLKEYNQKHTLREKILQEALDVAKKILNENSDNSDGDELYQNFTEREKELNDMFVEKYGFDSNGKIKISPDLDNFYGTEAECKAFRVEHGIVKFKTLYDEWIDISELCDFDEEYDAITGHNDPNENYNIVKSWCDQN